MNNKRLSWLLSLTVALFFAFIGSLMAAEGARPADVFNHDQTKFPLTGLHTNTACESCHLNGVFKGTPVACGDCHSRGGAQIAQMKSATHIPTALDCSVCHRTLGWAPSTFTHALVTQGAGASQPCSACHNGTNQTGKPVTHIMTTQDCGVCHKTTAWVPAGYDHAGMVIGQGGCTTCHNGGTATGKPANHIRTNQQCDVCHTSFSAWLPAGYKHLVTDTDCQSCHNGVNATGQTSTHIKTNQQCSVCHTQQAWLPAYFDHAGLSGYPALDCKSCHNGVTAAGKSTGHIPESGSGFSYANCDSCHNFSGWKPSTFAHLGITVASGTCGTCHIGGYTGATVKPATHLPTAAQRCDDCHQSTAAWLPTSFAHTSQQMGTKVCTDCHNKTNATGRPATHSQLILLSGQCDTCHNTTAWKPTPMNHTGQTACITCHTFQGNTWTPLYSGHINTGTRQCSDCHAITSWLGPTFNHTGISAATSCATNCHDGTHATGRPTSGISAHTVAPMTNDTCGSCHAVWSAQGDTFKSPVPVMNHNGATACTSCHSYTTAKWSIPGSPTFTNHINTTAQCSNCHVGFKDWTGGKVNHSTMTATTDCFSGCHDATHGTGKPTSGAKAHMSAPMTNNTCGTCHANKGVSWVPATMNNHTGATACALCHSYSIGGSTWTPTAPYANHVNTTLQCSACHKSFTSFSGATISHTGYALTMDCRTGCHDGTHGTAAPSTGVSAHTAAPMNGPNCGNCHTGKGVSWTNPLALPQSMNSHSGATSCNNCHSYTTQMWSHPGSPTLAGHIATTQPCSACHHPTTYSSAAEWRGPTFNHAANNITRASSCIACHDGTHGTGAPTSGTSAHTVSPMSGNPNCGNCHQVGDGGNKFSTSLTLPGSMNNHTGATACSRCHSYSTAMWSHPGSPTYTYHVTTSAECTTCHHPSTFSTAAEWKLATQDHSQAPFNSTTCVSSQCHNGIAATGVPTTGLSAHLLPPMTATTCGTCHLNKGVSWSSTMDHTGTSGKCAGCHSYSTKRWAGEANVPNLPFAPHIVTGIQCDQCHASTTNWNPGTFDHATKGVSLSTSDCFSGCHDGTHGFNGQVKTRPTNHVYTPMNSNKCGACHTSASFSDWTTPATKAGRMNGHTGATSCSLCHSYNSAYPSAGDDWTIGGTQGTTKPVPGHPSTTAQCSLCHTTAHGWTSVVHNGLTATSGCTQAGCHTSTNTVPPLGTSAAPTAFTHATSPMTSMTCGQSGCHTIGGGFGIAIWNHNGVSLSTTCAGSGCHQSGNTSSPKGTAAAPLAFTHATAPMNSPVCGNCHAANMGTTSWQIASPWNHVGITAATNCTGSGCHQSGNMATPLGSAAAAGLGFTHATAPMNSPNCGNCHAANLGTNSWHITGAWNHAGLTTASNCTGSGCHTGTSGASPMGSPASGFIHAGHTPMDAATCAQSGCHTSNFGTSGWALPPPPWSHTGVTAACSTCHSYTGTSVWTTWVQNNPATWTHQVTSAPCSTCHSATKADWTGAANHSGLTAASTSCTQAGCHVNSSTPAEGLAGASAHGFPHSSAPMTSLSCAQSGCHQIGSSWVISSWTHTGLTTASTCTGAGCHQTGNTNSPKGTAAAPAQFNHLTAPMLTATGNCGSCHTSLGGSWNIASWNHAGVTLATGCAGAGGCHSSGNTASPMGTAKATQVNPNFTHITSPMSSATCGNCHTSLGGTWPLATWNHTGVTTTCSGSGCHQPGNTTSPEGTAAATAAGFPHSSLPMSDSNCGSCHTSRTSWPLSSLNHTGITTSSSCVTSGCHELALRVAPRAGRPTSHSFGAMAAATATNCGACHTGIGTAWLPVTMNHTVAAVAAATCASCHSFTTPNYNWNVTKANHLPFPNPTAGITKCSDCHNTTAWTPAVYSHTGVVVGSCYTCHNGTTATGPDANHPASTTGGATATFKCDACHRTTAWLPPAFTHTGVTSGCANCHKTGFATAPSATHFITTQPCEKCHTTTVWSPIKSYVHISPYYKQHSGPNMTVYADCLLCHINNNEVITGAPHKGNAAYKPNCAWCHATQFKAGSHTKTTSPTTVLYTVAELTDCSGACHTYTNNTYTTIKTSRTGHHHSTDGGF